MEANKNFNPAPWPFPTKTGDAINQDLVTTLRTICGLCIENKRESHEALSELVGDIAQMASNALQKAGA
jgi:hypothetical protein